MNKNGRCGPFSFLKNTFRLFRIKIHQKNIPIGIFLYICIIIQPYVESGKDKAFHHRKNSLSVQ